MITKMQRKRFLEEVETLFHDALLSYREKVENRFMESMEDSMGAGTGWEELRVENSLAPELTDVKSVETEVAEALMEDIEENLAEMLEDGGCKGCRCGDADE